MTIPATLQLPREQWTSHPHYPRQVLLLRSHEGFRRYSRWLVERAEEGQDAQALGRSFAEFKSAMRSHEAYEEHKLYPYLEARWPISCGALRQGHDELAHAEAAVLEAVAQGPASKVLIAALRHHDEVLWVHLDEEEAVVIPALLALTPQEFEDYYHNPIARLLTQLG